METPTTMAAFDAMMSSSRTDTGARPSREAGRRNTRDLSCDSPNSRIELDTGTITISDSEIHLVNDLVALHHAGGSASDIYPAHRPRKGHKKSRGGCHNCKKRKIKCQENQPACHNCAQKKLECEYPRVKILSALKTSSVRQQTPLVTTNLQSTPILFTLTDMRFFHHYLLDAYPHLPVGNDSTWLWQIPLIAQHNQYLMHAILGLAASHLNLLIEDDLSSIALHHRVRAIHGSASALTKTNRTGDDGDALLASCFLLTFQSSYMKDGIFEFFHFVRGCSLVSKRLEEEMLPMAFFLTAHDHIKIMEERLTDLPSINPELLDSAERSLARLPPLFDLPAHDLFFTCMTECIATLRWSSIQGYFKLMMTYQVICEMNNGFFKAFSDPLNTTSCILLAHFMAMQLLLAPILDREWAGRTKSTPCIMDLDWVATISAGLPAHMRCYVEWPMAVADAVLEEVTGVQLAVPRIPILRKKEGFSKDIVLGCPSKKGKLST